MKEVLKLYYTASGEEVIESLDDSLYYAILTCLVCATIAGLAAMRAG